MRYKRLSNKKDRRIKHGLAGTKEYDLWRHMLSRCYNPKDPAYEKYGLRGIKVCDRWLSYYNFWEDMKDGYEYNLQLDRINNDGDYEPNNCRWATQKEQARNRRSNRIIEYKGKSQPVIAWAEEVGIASPTIRRRLNDGWTVENALTMPVLKSSGTKKQIASRRS